MAKKICACWQEISFHWNATLIGRAAGGGRGGGLPYRPDEHAPLHELRGEGQPRAARGRSRRPCARGQRAARGPKEQGGTRAQGAGRHADGLGAAPSSCSPRLLPRPDGELQTSAPGADSRPPAILVLVSSSRTAPSIHPPPAVLERPCADGAFRMDTGRRLVDRMPINPKIAVFESTQER
ncbi:protein argonaute 14-like [Panicum virgatum]|nr:protein argonaute 14-like [Panicum virgatum]KAG2588903.1 hypothetical protein PVAP13_5NG390262 [Panicum virgatum]